MKLQYYPDGDILYVEFSNALIEETRDITEQALGEFDNQDRLVAVTLSGVSQYIDVEALPAPTRKIDRRRSRRFRLTSMLH